MTGSDELRNRNPAPESELDIIESQFTFVFNLASVKSAYYLLCWSESYVSLQLCT